MESKIYNKQSSFESTHTFLLKINFKVLNNQGFWSLILDAHFESFEDVLLLQDCIKEILKCFFFLCGTFWEMYLILGFRSIRPSELL